MNNKIVITTFSAFTLFLLSVFQISTPQQKDKNQEKVGKQKEITGKVITIVKVDSLKSKLKTEIKTADTIKVVENLKFKVYKKLAHASYYHNKFNGRKTASGSRFDNSKYTAAHKKLPFGTVVKVTNEANGKSVIVQITDRGPFSKVREIDLSQKAFMEITSNKNSGVVIVTLEIVEN